MKLIFSDFDKKTIQAYLKFRNLWKVDDREWVDQRKKAWLKYAGDDAGNPITVALGQYYVFGEEPPSFIGEDKATGVRVDFDFGKRIAYTPFEEAEQLEEFWLTTVKLRGEHSERCHSVLRNGWADGLPGRDEKIRLVFEALYSRKYFMNTNDNGRLLTIRPEDFLVGYSGLSTFYHRNNTFRWDYRNISFDYFMLCVDYVDRNSLFNSARSKTRLPNMYKFLLDLDDSVLSEYRLQLKQKLITEAEAPNAPGLLRNALAEAKGGSA